MSDDIPRPGHYRQDRAGEYNREIDELRRELAAKEAEVEKAIGELVIEVGRRMTAERELAECRAASPPAPAAIVNCGRGHFDAFQSVEDARAFIRGPLPLWLDHVSGWTWHPAAAPDAAREDHA